MKIYLLRMASLCFGLVLISTFSLPSFGQILRTDIKLSELSWIDRKYFDKQRQVIDDIGRGNYGTRIRGGKTDLELLQRIIDGEHIAQNERSKQLAMGIVLGDIYVAERGLQWREYEDEAGRSRGVCLPDTEQCLFPLSMITRRMRVTEDINIQRIYDRGLELIESIMPKLPYSYSEEPVPEKREDRVKYRRAIPYIQ